MSNAITCHDPLIKDLLTALGIDTKDTVSVDIRVAVDEPVTVTQKRFVTQPAFIDVSNLDSTLREGALERFKREIVKYKLVPVDEKAEPPKAIG